jgi:hypothetical protein
MTATTAPALSADLVAGLRRLKLATVRRLAPELCLTARTQRWAPEELLRTLIEAEITAREESNLRGCLKQAGFPVTKTLDEFQVQLSSVPPGHLRLPGLSGVGARPGERLPDRAGGHRQVAL